MTETAATAIGGPVLAGAVTHASDKRKGPPGGGP